MRNIEVFMGDKKYNAKEALTSIYLVKNKEEKEGYLCLGHGVVNRLRVLVLLFINWTL